MVDKKMIVQKYLMKEKKDFQNRALVILGMHRSGTSALAGVMHILGIAMGDCFVPPEDSNPKGHWEHLEIMRTHKRILRELGYNMGYDVRSFPEGWWKNTNISSFKDNLKKIISQDFKSSPLWGFKDPRTCRLVPLWNDIFEEIGCQPIYLFILRHPIAVAQSLSVRDDLNCNMSLLLWIQYVFDVYKHTDRYHRIFLTYSELLENPMETLKRIAEEGSFQYPNQLENMREEINSFLTPQLCHQHDKPNEKFFNTCDKELADIAISAYEILVSARNGLSPDKRIWYLMEQKEKFDRKYRSIPAINDGGSYYSAILQRIIIQEYE